MREEIHYYTEEAPDIFSIGIGGKSWCDGSYRIFREKSDTWVLEYIISGEGTISFDGQSYHPGAGDVYLLPPGKKHLYYSSDGNPWVKIFVNCKGSIVDGLADSYGLMHHILYKNVGKHAVHKFMELYQLMNDKRLTNTETTAQIEIIIHEIFRELGKSRVHLSDTQKEMKIVKDYLDTHITELVKIERMVQLIFRSPDYLIKQFKKEYGVTPYQYLLEQKIKISKLLLHESQMTVSEISRHLGYDDPHYFSNLFKKESGMSPLKFRKAVQR